MDALQITAIILAILSFIGFLGTATAGEFSRAVVLMIITVVLVVFILLWNKKK